MFLFDILYNHLSFLKHTKLKSNAKKKFISGKGQWSQN